MCSSNKKMSNKLIYLTELRFLITIKKQTTYSRCLCNKDNDYRYQLFSVYLTGKLYISSAASASSKN